jgi:uroporphyrinogen-III synthase
VPLHPLCGLAASHGGGTLGAVMDEMAANGSAQADTGRLAGLRVVAFESRRAAEMAELIRRHGGEPIVAPSMREVPLCGNTAAVDFVRQLDAGHVDVVILMTGAGVRTLADVVADTWPRQRLAAALGRVTLVARGPKPAGALRELGRHPTLLVPEPNTWREVLATLDVRVPVAGKRVAVLEYGITNPQLLDGLAARGATVLPVPVYRWALPEDPGPLQRAIQAVCDGAVDIALFTSATQVYHVFQVAGADTERLRRGFARAVIASVGPICSEALREHGLAPDLEPQNPKMGALVAEVAQRGRARLAAKRGA